MNTKYHRAHQFPTTSLGRTHCHKTHAKFKQNPRELMLILDNNHSIEKTKSYM